MEKPANSFNVLAQYIKDFSFENPKAPTSLSIEGQGNINISVNVNVNQLKEGTFEVELAVTVAAGSESESVFMLEIKYAGLFEIVHEDKDEIERILLIHCPNLLFPYVRRLISDTTRDGGFPPLMLNPVDFMGLYLKKKQDEQQEKAVSEFVN
jgi:preprotein translocase subunit SecB